MSKESVYPTPPSEATDDVEVVVIGAGQAGLAMGHFLKRQGGRFLILERAGAVAPAWRERWESLTLFTPRRYSALPGLPFPGDLDGYPTRDEVIAYLERYAEAFELPVMLNTEIEHVVRGDDGRFRLTVDGRTIQADQVVDATGPFQTPYVPKLAEKLAADVFQTHAVGYDRPEDVSDGTILVVGGGNTGFQIAKELSARHRVVLSVGSRQKPLPQRLLGRDLFWWLTKARILDKTVESRLGRKLSTRDTLIGSSPREMTKRYGVELRPRLVDADGRTVSFQDGSELEVDAVIWATGYRSDHSWITLPIFDETGRLRPRRGVTEVRGLYFLGLTWQHTRGSALIGWVGDDAEFIAREIEARAGRASWEAPEMEHTQGHTHPNGGFPTGTEGLPEAVESQVIDLADGDAVELRIAPVAKQIGDATVRMLAYNGSIPGPTLRVREGSELVVAVANEGDLEATVHWHGLRLDNRYDGTHETQAPIPVGGRFSYRIEFPDPGAYWYHPHIREDYGQEMGLYGNILVVPADPDYWPPAHRELLLTLDDVLLEDGTIAPFSRSETTYAAMGRFGNVLLVGGEPDLTLSARRGEVVHLYLTNTANTRVFNVALPGARMKLVGGDSGRYEHEQLIDSVILAPSERVVVDVLFDEPGELTLEHGTPERTYALATIGVSDEAASPSIREEFDVLRRNAEWTDERKRLAPYLDAPPDKTLSFIAEMDLGTPEGPVVYACPMHPEVVSDEPGTCPQCGMKLLATAAPESYVCPMHSEVTSDEPGKCPQCGMKLLPASVVATASGHEHDHAADQHAEHHDEHHTARHSEQHTRNEHHSERHTHGDAGGIEWEDDMVDVNRITTPANTRWSLVDKETGAANHAIDWQFRVGDRIKLRLVNEMDSDHPMHHPFHVHGAGRFVVLARDGVPEENYVWKDTVLLRTGETVDVVLDVTNPGRWMAHCHIAEHHESGMMFSFDVLPAEPT